MLKDRKALLEHEIRNLTNTCSQMYLKIVTETASSDETYEYYALTQKLADLKTDLSIVDHMISSGDYNDCM